jgi:peptide methionine sulfoxide reductase MsrA
VIPLENMAQVATIAAGCFWSVELAFQRVPGVTKVGSRLFVPWICD